MSDIRYPRPPITTLGLFQAIRLDEPPAPPAWWPNDKHRVLAFQPPVLPDEFLEEDL